MYDDVVEFVYVKCLVMVCSCLSDGGVLLNVVMVKVWCRCSVCS